MNLIRAALDRPIAVIAAVMMVVMFGFVALQVIPIQLTPDVRKPVLTVQTTWFAAAPAEVEREIVNRQEEVIKGLEGLAKMTSTSRRGFAEITLEFNTGTNMDRALVLLGSRLDRVTGYPDEADEPIIKTSGSDDSPIAWFILTRAKGNTKDIHTFGDFVDDVIKERIERVKGVALVNVFGGSERELQVIIDPQRMARFGLTVSAVLNALRRANASVSAGYVDEGKRRYTTRVEGELNTIGEVRAVLVRSLEDKSTGRIARVTVGDIADVKFGYKDPTARIRMLAQQAMAINAVRDTGANVIETMRGIREAVAELNVSVLPRAGLKLQQVYDETVYINSAVNLVQQNIWVGGTFAIIVLLLFLGSFRATLVVALAIPVSVIGSFVAMAALGRSINVISLAGFAFAVGMVVDAAIVVLENIYRLREEGKSIREAAYEGASQVWGAVLVSALTTVMVFIPILVMELEVGQLFRDIAVAISVSVLLSLIVAITLIPSLANWLLGLKPGDGTLKRKSRAAANGAARSATREAVAAGEARVVTMRKRLPLFDDFAAWFVRGVMGATRRVVKNRALAASVVILLCGFTAVATYILLPKLEYLPEGNRNLIFGYLLPPPGYNLQTTTALANEIEGRVKPYWATLTGRDSKPGQPVKMERFFFVATPSRTFLGASAVDGQRAAELIPVLAEAARLNEPGNFGVVRQLSLFGRGISGGRAIELDVRGPNLADNLTVALRAFLLLDRLMPRKDGNQFRPVPGLTLGAPEIRVLPDRLKLADNGVSGRELADTVDTFNDGLRVAEITVDGERIDLMLKGPFNKITSTQGIGAIPVVTASGKIVPTSSLAKVKVTTGPTQIRHTERARTVTLVISPSAKLPLETAIDLLRTKVVGALEKQGIPPGVKFRIAGTADKLTETWRAMVLDLLLAIVIVYLVMAVLFESFLYPFIIILSVPLATAGGVLGLAVLNIFTYQLLDMLTLLGFVILVGIVVNNAILLVHQTLRNIRLNGMSPPDAIVESTRTRIRPIFMSTLTSVFGMLPLVVFPGAGSELYRGLGSVVVGGLALSALLTLGIIPALLTLFVGKSETRRRAHHRDTAPAPAGE